MQRVSNNLAQRVDRRLKAANNNFNVTHLWWLLKPHLIHSSTSSVCRSAAGGGLFQQLIQLILLRCISSHPEPEQLTSLT